MSDLAGQNPLLLLVIARNRNFRMTLKSSNEVGGLADNLLSSTKQDCFEAPLAEASTTEPANPVP